MEQATCRREPYDAFEMRTTSRVPTPYTTHVLTIDAAKPRVVRGRLSHRSRRRLTGAWPRR